MKQRIVANFEKEMKRKEGKRCSTTNSDFPNEKLKFFSKAKIFPTRGAKISPGSKNFQGEPISKRGSKILGWGGEIPPGGGQNFAKVPGVEFTQESNN